MLQKGHEMRVAAYCRVSTEKEEQLDSLDKQKEFFEDFAERNHYDLVNVYADEGISGKQIKNRTQFQRMLNDAKFAKFDKVVVKDISRFARNTVDFLTSIRELRALNVEVEFLSNNQTILGNSEFILTIFSAMAQEESANLSKRVKFGKAVNAKKGKVPNFVYGYNQVDKFTLEINPEESQVVKQIFQFYNHEGYGAMKIAKELNNRSIRTKRGSEWSQNAIARILKNKIYIGQIINKKSEVVDFISGKRNQNSPDDWIVTHKPEYRIISDEEFNRANAIISNRKEAFEHGKERQSSTHVFSTLIKCECCGYSFRRFERTYVNTTINWICSGRNLYGAKSCSNSTKIDEKELLDEIKIYFTDIIKNKNRFIKDTVKNFDDVYQSKETNLQDATQLQKELTKFKKQKEKQMIMFENEIITVAELKEKMIEINANIHRIENKLMQLENNISNADLFSNSLTKTLSNINDIIKSDHFTNAMLKEIIEKITVNADGEVTVRLKVLNETGLENTVLECDIHTQRPNRASAEYQSRACE